MLECVEEWNLYLKRVQEENELKIKEKESVILEREKALQEHKTKTGDIVGPEYLIKELNNYRNEKEILDSVTMRLFNKKEFIKEERQFSRDFLSPYYESIIFSGHNNLLVGCTKDLFYIFSDKNLSEKKTQKYLVNWGKFKIDIALTNKWCADSSSAGHIAIKSLENNLQGRKIEVKGGATEVIYFHPHINLNGLPCLGEFQKHIAECFNRSGYFDIFLILAVSFISSFNTSSCYPSASEWQKWRNLFVSRGALIEERNENQDKNKETL